MGIVKQTRHVWHPKQHEHSPRDKVFYIRRVDDHYVEANVIVTTTGDMLRALERP